MYEVGGISTKSQISATDTVQSIIIKMLGDANNKPIDTSTPNTRYKSQNLGTLSSVEDVDNFLYRCNHDTGYYGATIGSYVTIIDGIYNKTWIIAGFDMEHNRTASDGTVYDNGYGICLIPKNSLGIYDWGNDTTKGYNGSTMHTSTLPAVANNLKKVLGDHLVLRNVLLSDSRGDDWHMNGYTWTTAYCTLMSVGQITGTFANNRNKYDDGEANYKLPLFNYETWSFDEQAMLRCVSGLGGDGYLRIYGVLISGSIESVNLKKNGLRPLIYIR